MQFATEINDEKGDKGKEIAFPDAKEEFTISTHIDFSYAFVRVSHTKETTLGKTGMSLMFIYPLFTRSSTKNIATRC